MTAKDLQQGRDHYFGSGIAKSYAKAFEHFHKAAEAGHPEPQFHLALCFEDGDGVKKDPVQAVEWYRKSATAGYAKAQNNLAVCYSRGQGVERDLGKAEKWYCMAAEQGYAPPSSKPTHQPSEHGLTCEHLNSLQNPDALPTMGFYYRFKFDHGAPYDGTEAVKWWLAEADRGCDDAQCNLGVCCELGLAVPQDLVEAAQWYRLAALQDHPGALNKLLVGILSSRIIPVYEDEWWRWYEREERFAWIKATRKGAAKGEMADQFGMGLVYEKGRGVPRDIVESYKWLKLAAAQDSEHARKRLEAITPTMTPEQIQKGDQRIREYKPLH